MTTTPEDPLEAGVRLGAAFDAHGVSYALGGALAYGFWAVPRATMDIDVNVFVTEDGLPSVVAALRSLGIDADEVLVRSAAEADGMFRLNYGEFRVDVFTPSIEFAWEAERTRVRAKVDDKDVWFLSAEAIAVFKLLFFRIKDRADLQRLFAVQPGLDVAWIRSHLVDMMGDEDDRVAFLDELTQ